MTTIAITRHTKFEDLPEYLTPEEIGFWLGLTRNKSYEFVRNLPQLKCGRLIRVPKSAVRAEVRR
jgi:hypothetical protein